MAHPTNTKDAVRVVARTTLPVDYLNEWVVEVDGVRRARFVGNDAAFLAARTANEWRNSGAEG